MKISDIKNISGMECIQSVFNDEEISAAYTSDLMSDVMANAPGSAVLITIQAHKNTVAVASLIDASAIIICNNRPVPEEMIVSAKDEEIAVFKTKDNQFSVSNKIGRIL
jgi:predicted transcriptional regulator